MFRKLFKIGVGLAIAGLIVFIGLLTTDGKEEITLQKPSDAAMMSAERGELLLGLAGCVNCHTDVKNDGAVLAGGRALETPFGTFFAPNISSDNANGIGNWSEEDFVRALRHGRRPDGANYFPAFPYAAYTRMTDGDMLAIRTAIMARPAEAEPNKPMILAFPSISAGPCASGSCCILMREHLRMILRSPQRGIAVPISAKPWPIAVNATRRAGLQAA